MGQASSPLRSPLALPICPLSSCSSQTALVTGKMLDLLTLLSAVGLQQEIGEANRYKGNLICDGQDSQDASSSNLMEEAAENLAAVFDSFEGAVSNGIGALLGTGEEQTEQAPVVLPTPSMPAKKVV